MNTTKRSLEERIEDIFKDQLKTLGVTYYTKTDIVNPSIGNALSNAGSKSGGVGNGYPDIKVLLQSTNRRDIPVMMEVKGSVNKLVKFDKKGDLELITTKKDGSLNYSAIQSYAVNGAVHYANAILDGGGYNEVIAIGLNGYENSDSTTFTELDAYYISDKNNRVPKKIGVYTDLSFLKSVNLDNLIATLDKLVLSDRELDALKHKAEVQLEETIKSIHQSLYDDERFKNYLETNEKLYLFCGLIMAGLSTEGVRAIEVSDFKCNDDRDDNDGTIIITRIKSFIRKKNCSDDKIKMITSLLNPVFEKETLWKPRNGESALKHLYKQVKNEIVPCLESNLHLDFTGKILNSLNDWVSIDNDSKNDVVLTPRYVTSLMTKLARTDMHSYVWDKAMGSAGFLVSAMEIMIRDAQNKIKDKDELDAKIHNIKEKQLLGIEILGNIYILAVLNMILMGDGSSNILNGDSFAFDNSGNKFPATVFLLNPPYSANGKGFNFVEKALSQMTTGYACILIQENAGSGNGLPYTKRILENNTLCASIHMSDIFCGKASVQTAIYLFQIARPHEEDDIVTFIDFTNDGYSRQNRKKSSQNVNLKDTDNALCRYAEVEAIVLGKKPKTSYYTEENGLVIKDTISLEGNDWTFSQHKKVNTAPTEADFRKTVADYLAWKVSQVIQEGV